MARTRYPRTCAHCGAAFMGRKHATRCSKGCRGFRGTLETRFWSKVDKRGPDECWEWQSARLKSGGYGAFNIGNVINRSNRVAWELTNGAIPEGMVVCHKCDNPPCCNPAHLFVGTQQDNSLDKARKLRQRRKLCPCAVRLIRRLAVEDVAPGEIARRLGVSGGCVDGVYYGRNWKHVA